MNRDDTITRPSSVAPVDSLEDANESADQAPRPEDSQDLDALCEAWSAWCRTRKLYVKPSVPPSILGRLRTKSSTARTGGPDAIASAELAAFHLAFLGQPEDALDRKVFWLHYFWRVRNVKMAADELGVSRASWYRMVQDFRTRVYRSSRDIFNLNISAGADLPSRSGRPLPSEFLASDHD